MLPGHVIKLLNGYSKPVSLDSTHWPTWTGILSNTASSDGPDPVNMVDTTVCLVWRLVRAWHCHAAQPFLCILVFMQLLDFLMKTWQRCNIWHFIGVTWESHSTMKIPSVSHKSMAICLSAETAVQNFFTWGLLSHLFCVDCLFFEEYGNETMTPPVTRLAKKLSGSSTWITSDSWHFLQLQLPLFWAQSSMAASDHTPVSSSGPHRLMQ